MAEKLIEKTKDFLTTDGKITRKGLLFSTFLGGLYLGLPAYLAVKNIGTIGKMASSAPGKIKAFIAKDETQTESDSPKDKFAAFKSGKTWKIAGVFTLAAAALIGADRVTSFKNENWNRLSHFGVVVGTVGNAAAGASADFLSEKRGFWASFGPRLLHKTTDVSTTAVDGTIEVAADVANTAAGSAAIFADPEDKEGKVVFAKPLSDKFVTVCVNRTDYSNPVKGASGALKWEKKTGPQAEANDKKIPAYVARMNTTAEDYKKQGSDFRKALEQSASGVTIIEPGHIKGGAAEIKIDGSCPYPDTKETRYNAETYLNSKGTGHLPPGPEHRGN